jgi:hypothetical protein
VPWPLWDKDRWEPCKWSGCPWHLLLASSFNNISDSCAVYIKDRIVDH